MSQATDAFRAGLFADALIACESVCRSRPAAVGPVLLRARILQECRQTMAPRAWSAAWSRDPLDAALQDRMLQSWLDAGTARRAADQGAAFLPQRCMDGTEDTLVQLLHRAGAERLGACWRDGDAVEVRCFHVDKDASPARVVMSRGDDEQVVEVTGGAVRVPLKDPHGVWSVAFERGPVLQGSPLSFDPPARIARRGRVEKGVDIVIPVYRDARAVQACVTSVLDSLPHNATRARVIVVNDASPEPQLVFWLSNLAANGDIELVHNRFNLGFIETVNKGLRMGNRDALMLNADTYVHGDWIDRLVASLASADDVASVMPWSNQGEIGSLIAGGTSECTTADAARIDERAATLSRLGATPDVEVPTNSGFAMLMRRRALDEIGHLDGESLTRGYLEEVDWCLRAREAGWRHLLATGVFVAHRGSASFGAEKELRVRQNRAVIAARYPAYYAEYGRFLMTDPAYPQRRALLDDVAQAGAPWPSNVDSQNEQIEPHAALHSASTWVAAWGLGDASPAALRFLELARRLASMQQPLRFLVFGQVSDALHHTGIVEGMARAKADALVPDAILASLAGCTEVLAAPDVPVPRGAVCTRVTESFDTDAWLAAHVPARTAKKLAA